MTLYECSHLYYVYFEYEYDTLGSRMVTWVLGTGYCTLCVDDENACIPTPLSHSLAWYISEIHVDIINYTNCKVTFIRYTDFV